MVVSYHQVNTYDFWYTEYFRYCGHVYSGHLTKVATSAGNKYAYFVIFELDVVANLIYWLEKACHDI